MASYLYRRGNSFYFSLRVNGRLIRKSLGAVDLDSARIAALRMKKQVTQASVGLITGFAPDGTSVNVDLGGDVVAEAKAVLSKWGDGEQSFDAEEAWQEYKDEREQMGDWSSKTLRGWEITFAQWLKSTEGELSYEAARRWQKELRARLAASTLNRQVGQISGWMDWCVRRGYVTTNYYGGQRVKTKKSKTGSHLPWTEEELAVLFRELPSLKQTGRKLAWRYWIPMIGLLTGARIEEVSQIEKEDIFKDEETGLWCWRIDRKVKNEQSRRIIPLHWLLETSFVPWAMKQQEGSLWLITANKDGDRSGRVVRWFSGFKTSLGFGQQKVFHSFRETVMERGKMLGVEDVLVQRYVGHKEGSIYGDVYGTGRRPLKQMKDAIETIW